MRTPYQYIMYNKPFSEKKKVKKIDDSVISNDSNKYLIALKKIKKKNLGHEILDYFNILNF